MERSSEDILIKELKRKFDENRRALHDLQVMNRKLEKLNKKLTEAEATKSNFLSNIRNEINNPLTSIMGLSRQMAVGCSDERTIREMAQAIYREAFDLDFQMSNILTAAEIEAGEASLSISKVDIGKLIRSLIDSFNHKAKEKHLEMEFIGNSPAGLHLRTDPEKLQKILSNLLANAIEYSEEQRIIRIRAWKDGEQLNISVEDEGIGIPDQEKEKIFERFKQLDSGIRKSHKGHGLGLSVSRALVEIINGVITFSPSPGEGSVFQINLKEAEPATGADVISEDGNEFIFETEEEF